MNKANVTATTAPSTGIPTRKATSRRHSGSRTRKNFGRPRSTTTALSATSSSSLTKPQPILPALVGETPCRSRAGLGVVTLGYGVVPVVLRGGSTRRRTHLRPGPLPSHPSNRELAKARLASAIRTVPGLSPASSQTLRLHADLNQFWLADVLVDSSRTLWKGIPSRHDG
jgi:hypothetical protein